MADINLEAEEVIAEEEEEIASRRRSGQGLLARKGVIIFAVILLVEAVVLFFVFDAIRGGGMAEAESVDEPEVSLSERYAKPGRIVLDDISIYDPTDPSPRGDRRFTLSLVLRVEGDAYQEIIAATQVNEFAMELVKDDIKAEVRDYLLRQGGNPLKNRDHQAKLPQRLKDHLNQELTPLRGKILKVDLEKFQPSKY